MAASSLVAPPAERRDMANSVKVSKEMLGTVELSEIKN
tara:strand:+ start:327 stop:440 length:114 start_codon:yes stop_codon:yes gene_type:complete